MKGNLNLVLVYSIILVMLVSVWALPTVSGAVNVNETYDFTPGWRAYHLELPEGGGLSFSVKVIDGALVNVYFLDDRNYRMFENSSDFKSIFDAKMVSYASHIDDLKPGVYHLVIESTSKTDSSKLQVTAKYGSDYNPFDSQNEPQTETAGGTQTGWSLSGLIVPGIVVLLIFLVIVIVLHKHASNSKNGTDER